MDLTFGEPLGGYEYTIKTVDGEFDSIANAEETLASAINALGISDEEKAELAYSVSHLCELREKSAAALILKQAGEAAGIQWRDNTK